MAVYWAGGFNAGEDLGYEDLSHRDGYLHRHVRGHAETAILMRGFSLRVRVRDGNDRAQHHQGDAQYAEQNLPRRANTRFCGIPQHSTNITQF